MLCELFFKTCECYASLLLASVDVSLATSSLLHSLYLWAGMRRSTRELSETTMHNIAHAAVEEIVVPEGFGTELGKLSGFAARLAALKNADPLLRVIFGLLYPDQTFTKETAKASIRLFKGFASDAEWDGSNFLFSLKSLPDLRRICTIFSICKSSTLLPSVWNELCCMLRTPMTVTRPSWTIAEW